MKIRKRTILIFAAGISVLFLIDAILIDRYQTTFNLNVYSVAVFLLYFSFSYLMVLISTLKYDDIINPLSTYAIFPFSYAFSCLPLSGWQSSSSNAVRIIIILSVLSFAIGVLLYKKMAFALIFPISLRLKKRILIVLVALSVICFILEIARLGYIPVLNYFEKRSVYEETNEIHIPFLHYFVLLSNILPSWAYIYYKRSVITRFAYINILIISTFILANFLSRQYLLLYAITTFLTFNYYFRFSLNKKITFGAFCAILFLLIGFVRLSQITDVDHGEYMKAYGTIQYETNLVEGWLVSYATQPFSKLGKLVEQNESRDNFHFGKYSLRPFFSILFLDRLGVIEYEDISDIEGAAGLTYAMDPYLDLSFFGTILFNITIGFYSIHIYRRYNNFHDDSIITWAIIVYCLIMTPFINYFSAFIIWFIWFTNQILVSTNSPVMRKEMKDL